MPNSANSSTDQPQAEKRSREHLVWAAHKYVRNGGKAADFAREHGLARTTVLGWCKNHDRPLGQSRKLDSFDETEILKLLVASRGFQTWKTVQGCVWKRSSKLERRTIFRLLKSWGLEAESANAGEPVLISASEWIQPPETMDGNNPALRATIWRIMSGRGMECFMLTADDSDTAVEKVAAAVEAQFEGRRKARRRLRTNHPGLATAIREKLPDWQVHAAGE